MTDVLDRIRQKAADLGAATDKMNEAISAAEAALTSTRLGVSATVHINETSSLHYGKIENKWGLYIVTKRTGDHVHAHRASRGLRMRASQVLPELLEKLLHELEERRVNTATESYLAFAESTRVEP